MDFYISKIKVFHSFRGIDGAEYRRRDLIELTGGALLDYPNAEIERLCSDKKLKQDSIFTIVNAGKTEQEFLAEGSAFEKKNIKIELKMVEGLLNMSAIIYLLDEDFKSLVALVGNSMPSHAYPMLVINTLGGRVTGNGTIEIQGYCEGIEFRPYTAKAES